MCNCLCKYKWCLCFLPFSGGVDSLQPVHSASQSIQFTKPGVGTSASPAVISSARTSASGLSSQPRSSPSVTQSPESALQEGTKREWEDTIQTSALFHVHMWMLEALLLFYVCLTRVLLLCLCQAPESSCFVGLSFGLFLFSSSVWFPSCTLSSACLCLFLTKPFS